MWESRRDFQRMWEGWKAGFWLSMLSIFCHFHGLLWNACSKSEVTENPFRGHLLEIGCLQSETFVVTGSGSARACGFRDKSPAGFSLPVPRLPRRV